MLTDAGRDDRIALGEFVEQLNGVLRHDDFVGLTVKEFADVFAPQDFVVDAIPEGEFLLPLLNLRVPRLERFAFDDLVQLLERVLDVGDDGQVRDFVFVDLARVNVDVDDGAVLGKLADFAGHAVVEANAEGEE